MNDVLEAISYLVQVGKETLPTQWSWDPSLACGFQFIKPLRGQIEVILIHLTIQGTYNLFFKFLLVLQNEWKKILPVLMSKNNSSSH